MWCLLCKTLWCSARYVSIIPCIFVFQIQILKEFYIISIKLPLNMHIFVLCFWLHKNVNNRVCVCVYVYLVFPILWGPNVPTSIVIPVHFDLLGTFSFSSQLGNKLLNHIEWKCYKIKYFLSKIAESFVWGVGLGVKGIENTVWRKPIMSMECPHKCRLKAGIHYTTFKIWTDF